MPPISSPEGNFLRRPQEHSIEFLNVDLGAPLVQNIFAFSSEENSRTIDTTSTASDISTFQTVSSKSVIYKEGQYSDWISNQDTPIDDQSTWKQSPSVEGPKSDRKRGTAHCSPSLISRLKVRVQNSWFMEMFANAVSILSLLAIIAVLAVMDQRLARNWPYYITINRAIAILSQISQMTMLFTTAECLAQQKWLWFLQKKRNLVTWRFSMTRSEAVTVDRLDFCLVFDLSLLLEL